MQTLKRLLPICVFGLSACNSTLSETGPSPQVAYNEMLSRVTAPGITPPSDVPSGGDATLTGIMVAEFDFITGTETVSGDAELLLNFEDDQVSGSFENLQGGSSGAISGTLIVETANLPGPGFFSGVAGDINVAGNIATIDGSIGGTLYGAGGVTGAAGAVLGDVTQTGFEGEFNGGYVVSIDGP